MKITFLGAAKEVTGSKYLIESDKTKLLVDCGIFQGSREVKKHNWDPFPIDPRTINAIVLTHAHLDHTGYIPVLIKQGFKGKIYCSKATYKICTILLKDSGFLQEEDARRANKHGYSRHSPALPLYTVKDAEEALTYFQTVDYHVPIVIDTLKISLVRSGHILGASFVTVFDGKKTVTFSGDLGRPHQPIMTAPPHLKHTDYLILESTYGDRLHVKEDPIKGLGNIISRIIDEEGILIIPSFAVGRTQMILYYLYQLIEQKIMKQIPIFLDSPMAINVTDLYCSFEDEHKLSSQGLCQKVFDIATYVCTVSESKSLNRIKGPAVIIAGSGMADGGRVLHHLMHHITNSKNTILFVGFQAKGTTGRYLINNPHTVKIYGRWYPVKALIEKMDVFSAHADYNEMLEWLSSFETAPKKVFLTHGELDAAQSLQQKIEERFGWSVVIPSYLESFDLD